MYGAVSAGPVYLPLFLTGLAALAMAGVQARRSRWAAAAGAALAAVLLVGALSIGYAAVSWRLAHPGPSSGSPRTPPSWLARSPPSPRVWP